MLATLSPASRVRTVIGILIDTVAVLFIKFIEAFVAAPIWILLDPEPVDLLILPRALELFTVGPRVSAETVHDSIAVVSSVDLFVWPALHAISIALVLFEVANEGHSVRITLFSDTLLHILLPLAFKNEIVDMARRALAVTGIIHPVSFICFTLYVATRDHMSEFALAMGFTKTPGACVGSSIAELHGALTVSEAA